MAWEDTMVTMLRIMVNDTEATQVYSDDRLTQIISVAAHYVNQEVDGFTNTYTITVGATAALSDISPDPTLEATLEEEFTNFVVMKASCLTDQSTYRIKALMSGIKAKCGPAVLETLKHADGFKELFTYGPCAAYEKLREQWMIGNANLVKAILSPFCSNNFDPKDLQGSGGTSRDYRW